MVVWTAEKEIMLLIEIIEFSNISTGGKALLDHLASKIGGGCTPKAVSHRINNMKARCKAARGGAATPNGTPNKSTSVKTPGSAARGRGRPAKNTTIIDDGDQEDERLQSPSVNRKRGRKPKKSAEPIEEEEEKQEETEEPAAKKIKKEEEEFTSILGDGDFDAMKYDPYEDEQEV